MTTNKQNVWHKFATERILNFARLITFPRFDFDSVARADERLRYLDLKLRLLAAICDCVLYWPSCSRTETRNSESQGTLNPTLTDTSRSCSLCCTSTSSAMSSSLSSSLRLLSSIPMSRIMLTRHISVASTAICQKEQASDPIQKLFVDKVSILGKSSSQKMDLYPILFSIPLGS